jgi:hypothetical protein
VRRSPGVAGARHFRAGTGAAPLVAELLTTVASLACVLGRAPVYGSGCAVGPLELRAGSEAMPPADLLNPAVHLFLERPDVT